MRNVSMPAAPAPGHCRHGMHAMPGHPLAPGRDRPRRFPARMGCLLALAAILLLAACKTEEAPPVVRPVRSMVAEKREVGDTILLTGQLRARDETNLAFRLSGKVVERPVGVGDTVRAGQVVARLDAEMETNARNAAEADVAAAQAALDQAEASERRLAGLLAENAVSRTDYEVAQREFKTARAQVSATKAKLKSANDQLGYTELKSEADGVITGKGAEPGEVVRAGQMVLILARRAGRDAVFDMPAQFVRDGLDSRQEVEVWLADNPDIRASGRVREVSPQADAATRTYQVKVGLQGPPAAMLLGATVVGRLKLQADTLIEVPSSALGMANGNPAVWVVGAGDGSVHLRPVTIARYTQDAAIIAEGLRPGERVVTAGAQTLYEGQRVKLLDE